MGDMEREEQIEHSAPESGLEPDTGFDELTSSTEEASDSTIAEKPEGASDEGGYPIESSLADEEHTQLGASEASKEAGIRLPIRWELGLYGILIAIAGTMRLWDLGSRAMHHDESLHAVYSWYLYVGRGYEHLPMMHGPFQFHVNSFIFFIFGDSDYTARLAYAIFGTVLVVLPFFFRKRLGNIGTLMVATLLTFSPAMLYFSRFARNDILMAVWTLGLVIAIWRYMDERKNRYLYLTAGLLAAAFSTKETVFIIVAVMGSFLLSLAAPEVIQWLRGRRKLSQLTPAGTLLLIFVTLSLPQWSAGISLFEGVFGIVLANADPAAGPVGAPLGGGMVIAGSVVVLLLVASMVFGIKWNRKVWLLCAAIFYSIWVLLYTSFFTNLLGLGSGMWQSLGYWIVQQDVQRGGQPWYYYFVITPVYEFLPLVFSLAAGIYYLRKRDFFGNFLVYWSVLTFFLYTMAGEKMPWLIVSVSLPLIIIAGRFLGEMVQRIQWRSLVSGGGLWLAPAVFIFALFFWRLIFFKIDTKDSLSILTFGILIAVLLAAAFGVSYLSRRIGTRNTVAFCALSFAVVLFGLTIKAGWQVNYENGDVPVEMLVYTQTSPDIPRVAREIELASKFTGQGTDIKVTIDSTDGFTWPWAWYLRDYSGVSYPCYSREPGCISLQKSPDSSVVLVNTRNNNSAEPFLDDGFSKGFRIKHRWWFPESYRGVTLGKFWDGLRDRSKWRMAADYFLHRKFGTELGSIDAYVYFSKDVPLSEVLAQ